MAKKNSTAKDTELSLSFFGKVAALFRSETVHFVIGLVLVIFSVYLLLAFTSFFFTGAADQSIIGHLVKPGAAYSRANSSFSVRCRIVILQRFIISSFAQNPFSGGQTCRPQTGVSKIKPAPAHPPCVRTELSGWPSPARSSCRSASGSCPPVRNSGHTIFYLRAACRPHRHRRAKLV